MALGIWDAVGMEFAQVSKVVTPAAQALKAFGECLRDFFETVEGPVEVLF